MENEKIVSDMSDGTEIGASENDTEISEIATSTENTEPLEPPRYVIKTTLNGTVQLEASKALAPKFGRVAGWLGIGLMLVMLAMTLWQLIRDGGNDRLFMALLLVAVIAFLAYTQFSAPKKAIRRWEANMRRSFGTEELHLTAEFFEHSLAQTAQETDDLIVEGYSKISELRETEHLLLLRCSARQWFFLEKCGFTLGDEESFKAFIRSRIGDK